MSFHLKPSAFDAARAPLDRLQARGWIWRGRQELNGLCCFKDAFQGQGWIGALTPWLDRAADVRETDKLVLLLFEKPVECDCAALGRLLPLRLSDGILSSFPAVLSGGALRAPLIIGPGPCSTQVGELKFTVASSNRFSSCSMTGLAARQSVAVASLIGVMEAS